MFSHPEAGELHPGRTFRIEKSSVCVSSGGCHRKSIPECYSGTLAGNHTTLIHPYLVREDDMPKELCCL